jgi:hypothetical protein
MDYEGPAFLVHCVSGGEYDTKRADTGRGIQGGAMKVEGRVGELVKLDFQSSSERMIRGSRGCHYGVIAEDEIPRAQSSIADVDLPQQIAERPRSPTREVLPGRQIWSMYHRPVRMLT